MRLFASLRLATLCIAGLALQPLRADEQLWKIAAAETAVRIHVGKSGMFSVAGHTHEVTAPAVSGTVRFDPERIDQAAIELTFDAKALKVSAKDEPPDDLPEVQATMLSDKVLDVARHPTIVYRSRQVAVLSRAGGRLQLRVTGTLTLHSVTRPIDGPVDVTLSSDRLAGSGTVTIKQTDFGIKPVSAGLGTVKVKDEVTVTYTFTARR